LTAMKYGVYALMAAVVGVMLVGMLPGQLSNLAAPTSLQGSKEAAGNVTLSGYGSTPSRHNDSSISSNTTYPNPLRGDTTVTPPAGATAGSKVDAASSGAEVTASAYSPLADVLYYGMMGLGFLVALTVYFAAKRML
jgi:hypothetical protein